MMNALTALALASTVLAGPVYAQDSRKAPTAEAAPGQQKLKPMPGETVARTERKPAAAEGSLRETPAQAAAKPERLAAPGAEETRAEAKPEALKPRQQNAESEARPRQQNAEADANRRKAEALILEELARSPELSRQGAALAIVARIRHERFPTSGAL